MKSTMRLAIVAISLFCAAAFSQSLPVKMSSTGICHAPGTTYYEQTKKFTTFKTLDDCLKAGGRLTKK
jgi:hypothetical protein